MATKTETLYGVARGQKILTHGDGFTTVDGALAELEWYQRQMQGVGLEPDVRLVEFDVTTSYERSKPRAYKEPEAEQSPEAPAEQGDTTPDA